jgi:predicted ArsR family transcriptional regulator
MSDRLNAAGDPELRRALTLARSRSEPLSADDAAAALGVHRNVARARLDRLASAGFLRVFFARRGDRRGPGAGRPAKLYEVAPETELLEFPERHLDDLGKLLVERLDEQSLRRTGSEYGRLLARRTRLRQGRDLEHGLERLCRRLGDNGFQVSVIEATATEATLACPTCPLRPIVRLSPEAAILDRGMWAGLVESSLDGVTAADVMCSTEGCSDDHATSGSCSGFPRADRRASPPMTSAATPSPPDGQRTKGGLP